MQADCFSGYRIHFIQPLQERVVRELGYGLSLGGTPAAALVKSKQSQSESLTRKTSA
jgi:hypothetical protein